MKKGSLRKFYNTSPDQTCNIDTTSHFDLSRLIEIGYRLHETKSRINSSTINSLFLTASLLIGGGLSAQENSQNLSFISNEGQWVNNVHYKTDMFGGAVFLEDNTFTFVQKHKDDIKERHHLMHEDKGALKKFPVRGHTWKMNFIGANDLVETIGSKKRSEYYNYFLGNDESKWAGGVSSFDVVHYSNLYTGVDMNVYSQEGNFKYDLFIAPNSNPSKILINYKGLDGISIRKGNLILKTSVGNFKELAPYAFQFVNGVKKEIVCNYVLDGTNLSFHFPDGYDNTLELVIDPVLVGATLSGSAMESYGHCATYDNSGHIYSGARCFGTGYPTSVGAFQMAFGGGDTDISISKYSSDATSLIYSTYLGGGSKDYPHSMIVNNNDELYITGSTESINFPVSATAFDNTLGGAHDIIVTHFNSACTGLIASTYVGGSDIDGLNELSTNYGDDFRGEIILDNSGNCFVTNCTNSSDFPASIGAYQVTYGGGDQDAVVFSMPSDLSTMNWSTYLGGAGHEVGFGLRLGNGGVYVCGATDNGFITGTGYQPTFQGGSADGYVVKLNLTGSAIASSTYWGTTDDDYNFFIDLDNDGDVYIYGQCSGINSPVSAGVYSNANSGQYIAKLTPTLSTPLFSTVIGAGASGEFVPIAFMVDDCEYIYFSGHEAFSGLPVTAAAFQTNGGFYLGVLEPDALGLNFATYYGGLYDHVDGGTSRFDPDGIVYQGVCSDGGFNTTPGAFSSTYPNFSDYDIGVFKIDFQVNTLDAVATISPSAVGCAPYTVTFTNTSTGNSYNWNFDDGSPIDTSIAPTHTFVNPGIYDVMLIAFDSTSCLLVDTTYLTITVGSPTPVIASFSYSLDCTTASVDAQSTGTPGGPGILYEWEMGDGTIYTDTIVSHFYATPGTYTITLIVVDTICGSADTTIMQVVVNGPLVDLGPDLLTCTPSLVLDALNPGATYLWQNGSNNQIFNVTDFGTYFVEVTEGGCTVSDTIVISQDTIEVILPSDALLCIGSSIILDAQNVGANYLWSDGSITQTITVISQGTYWVEVTEGVCYASDTITIDFYAPTPQFDYTDTIGCSPLVTNFTDLSATTNSAITSWYWTFGDGSDSNQQNPSHQYAVSGVYNVTLTVVNSDGCSASLTQAIQITIYPSPIALFAFTPNQPMSGDLISFVDQSVNASTWNWNFGDGTNSILQNPKHTFEDNANFEVQLIVTNEQCIDSITRLITIQEELIFYVPNTFTPDGDQHNNTFFPVFTSGFDPFDYQLTIFNRWGEVIFESFNSENGWDGTYGGKLVQDGTYTWKIEFGDINTDERHIVHGHVSMIR